MIFFNTDVFCLSDQFFIKKISLSVGNIFIIDNFYKDLNLVCGEIEKLPVTLVWNESRRKNLQDMVIDGRKSYVVNMSGTDLPYRTQIPQKICRQLESEEYSINVSKSLLINSCKKLKNYTKDKYYNIHYDPQNDLHFNDQFALIVFLNQTYTDATAGLNIFEKPKKNNFDIFTDKNLINIEYFVKSKPNRAVLLHKSILHSQENGSGKQFYDEYRLTQVIFMHRNKKLESDFKYN